MEIITAVFEIIKWVASGGWEGFKMIWPQIHLLVAALILYLGIWLAMRILFLPFLRSAGKHLGQIAGAVERIEDNHLKHIAQDIKISHDIMRSEGKATRETFNVRCPVARKKIDV